MRYYYATADGATVGPVGADELGALRRAGTLDDATPVIREGDPAWSTYAALLVPPSAPPVVPAIPPRPAVAAGTARPPEEVLREGLSTGVAYAGAAAKLLGEAVDGAARRGARAVQSYGAGTTDAPTGTPAGGSSSAAASGGLARRHAALAFGVLQLAMLLLPIGWVTAKGREMPVTVFNAIRTNNALQLVPLLAFCLPAVGLALALRARETTWRPAAGVVAVLAALLTHATLGSVDRVVKAATMGIADVRSGLGLWVVTLGCLALAALALLPTLRRLAAAPPTAASS